MKTILTLAIFTSLATMPARAHDARAEIQSALDTSAAAWSRADLDGFMQSYENAPDTIFVGGDKIVTGYRAIRDRYVRKYGNATAAAMGHLTIDILCFRAAGPLHAFIVGRYHLVRAGAKPPVVTGLTTLLFHKTPVGWRIVADHTD